MHPLLTLDNNPMCVEQIRAFKKCHDETSYLRRALGACNQHKALMDRQAPCILLQPMHMHTARTKFMELQGHMASLAWLTGVSSLLLQMLSRTEEGQTQAES
eukprot:scaffold145648_cov37-Tisochrysis_lutea.AAC.1